MCGARFIPLPCPAPPSDPSTSRYRVFPGVTDVWLSYVIFLWIWQCKSDFYRERITTIVFTKGNELRRQIVQYNNEYIAALHRYHPTCTNASTALESQPPQHGVIMMMQRIWPDYDGDITAGSGGVITYDTIVRYIVHRCNDVWERATAAAVASGRPRRTRVASMAALQLSIIDDAITRPDQIIAAFQPIAAVPPHEY